MSRSSRGRHRRSRPADATRPGAAPRAPAWLGRAELLLALAGSAVALLLHVRLLARAGPLWRDEVNTLVVATQPTLEQLRARLDTESSPLLPFALLRAWCAGGLGRSDLGLRCFGLLFGVLVLAAVWLSRRLLGPSVPLLSLGLFALGSLLAVAARALGTDPGLQGPVRGGAWRASRRRHELVLYGLLTLLLAVPLHFAMLLHRPDLVKRMLAQEDPAAPVFRARAGGAGLRKAAVPGGVLGDRVTEPPPRLPPPPGTPTGWWQGTYGANWSARLQYLLQHHARSARGLDVAASQAVIPYEVASAWVVEGWR